jgi:type I site-specific restriction endonuclease
VRYLYQKIKSSKDKDKAQRILVELPTGYGKSRIMIVLGILLLHSEVAKKIKFKYLQRSLMERDQATYS